MGRLDDKVVMITGGARGQGRSHAVTFAREGASVGICDLAREGIEGLAYPLATAEDLEETRRLVEDTGQEVFAATTDVRDARQITSFVDGMLDKFGRIDVLCANAGIVDLGSWNITEEQWDLMMDVNLKSVWLTCRAVIPHMIENDGGVIVCTGSTSALTAYPSAMQYGVAKHGILGLVHHLAVDLAPHHIRVNSVCPTAVPTPMLMNEALWAKTTQDSGTGRNEVEFAFRAQHLLSVPWVEVEDVSNALVWLVSDEARYVTGLALPIDAGALSQPPGIPPEAMARLTQ